MIGNWIELTTETEGTGPLTLDAPVAPNLGFSNQIPSGEKAYYEIENGNDREAGIGTVGANSLTRDELVESTTGAFLNLVGTSVVRCVVLAEMLGAMGGRLHMAASVANSGNTYLITTRPRLRALADGARVRWRANVTNAAGGASADVDSTGPKPIRKGDFAPVESYEIRLNDIYEMAYDAAAQCWQLQSPVYGLPQGRSALINGAFRVAQRGTSFSGLAFGDVLLDRWRYLGSAGGGTAADVNASQQSFSPGQGDVPGEPTNFLRLSPQDVGASLGAASNAVLAQRVLDVRTFAGARAASRVWMRSTIPGKRVGFRLRRHFGTGGSADDFVVTNQSLALSTIWQPFDLFWTLASLSGKTVADGSYLGLQIFLQWGSDFDSDFGTSGGEAWRAAGDIEIADATFQPGHLVVPFDRRSFAEDLAACRTFARIVTMAAGSAISTTQAQFYIPHEGMRAKPTLTVTGPLTIVENANARVQSSAQAVISDGNADGSRVTCSNFVGLTANNPVGMIGTSAGKFLLDAEP